MSRSYVVTGGGRGIGRALVERLLGDTDNVVAIELDPAALAWTESHPAGPRVIAVVDDDPVEGLQFAEICTSVSSARARSRS
jgi:NAD(P)-dependent dehydrogenase (short-subunit alcohol dehydrogenase family)